MSKDKSLKNVVRKSGWFYSLWMVGAAVMAGMAPTAHAEQKGSLPNYGPGFSIGVAFAALPKHGLYWSQKLAYGSVNVVNGAGADTGIHTNVYLTTSMLLLSTKYHVLGAQYGAFVYDVGAFHAHISMPGGASGVVTSAADFEFDPIDLSWHLGKHFYVGVADGFSPPVASYNPHRLVNVGHDRYTFQQHVSLSYVSRKYLFSANGVFSVNTENRYYDYRSGSTYDCDFSALRRFGAFETGPVGYYFDQFGGDSGPKYLDGGKPTEAAVGWLFGWKVGKWSFDTYVTRDVYSRNFGKQTKVWFSVARKIF